jgi:DNA-binding NtrC family response regulator
MPQTTGRILIVDDEPSLLKMVSTYLKRLGYTVATASSAEKAWAEVEAAPESVALVVLDGTMKGIPLEELAPRMLAANSLLKVIAASGYPVDVGPLNAVAPGRVMFLHKPFSPEMLGTMVRRMLGTQEAEV